ncbi:MAG TPA: PH domain-containing protein [Candidatus Paceibacterota bacterium]|nr:PH domain-containing protein [Candidatus Paceibacterota bacterium]
MLYERIKLESDEEILQVVRKHWWIITTRVLSAVVSMLMPLILFGTAQGLLSDYFDTTTVTTTYQIELWFIYLGWVLFHWIAIANFWTDHYLDLWAITNRRIVAIEQSGFFHRFLSSFRLERLQDMNISVKGIIPTLLNFGRIEAQTAGGSNEEFATNNMPDPRGLKALIIRAADERQRALGTQNPLNSDGTS